MEITPVAHFHSPFPSKFGLPRQSGLSTNLTGHIIFEKEYRDPSALRGLEGFDYLWLLWEFSGNRRAKKSLTVRPPRLGGNVQMGVFATRSPFRPNNLGLSAVKIDRIDLHTAHGPVIHVLGADLMDGTPIYDIKPYLRDADAYPEARSGFADTVDWQPLEVDFPARLRQGLTAEQVETLMETLRLDPRPPYQEEPERIYGMPFDGRDIRFRISDGRLTVVEVV